MTKEEKKENLRNVAEMLRDVLDCAETPEEEGITRTALNAVMAI